MKVASSLFLVVSLASCHAKRNAAPSLHTALHRVPRGGGEVNLEKVAMIKAITWGFSGVTGGPAPKLFELMYETESLEASPMKKYCVESFCWSALGVALLSYFAACTDMGTTDALGYSSLPALYFLYKETLNGTYEQLGYAPGRGPTVMVVVAMCVAGLLLDKNADLAGKVLIGLTTVSCASGAFCPEFGASTKGVVLKDDEKKWWSWMNRMPLEWAFLASALVFSDLDPTKVVGYATLFWAALLVDVKFISKSDVVGNPLQSTLYLLFSLVTGGLMAFYGDNGGGATPATE